MDLKITKQVEELEKHAAENAMQIGAMKAFMKLNFGGEHTDKLPKLLDGSEKTPLEMLHKIGLHLARMCEGMAQPTGGNSLHKHIVSNNEAKICEHCGKYKRLQGNGMIHPICECGSEVAVKGCHNCKNNPHAPFVPEICDSCYAPGLNNWQPLTDC